MPAKKIRVAELAKELGMTNKETLDLAVSIGIRVKNVSSSMEEAQADRVRRKALKDGLTRDVQPPKVFAPKKTDVKNKNKKVVRYPTPSQYDDSLFDPQTWFLNPDLKKMKVYPGGARNDTCIMQTGGFACVAKAEIASEDWAVRLLYRQQVDIQERYRVIDEAQKEGKLPDVIVPIQFFSDEIGVSGSKNRFPVVLIKWVEGVVLNRFVRNACLNSDSTALMRIRLALQDLREILFARQISHGDLSGDNLMVVSKFDVLSVKLLDYDSLWFPEIGDLASSVGDGEMQHPGYVTRGARPSGPGADLVAFRIYDLVLQVLERSPELGIDEFNYEFKFFCTRAEVANISSEFVRLMREVDPTSFLDLQQILKMPYPVVAEKYLEVSAGFGEMKTRWSIDDLSNMSGLSVGQLRSRALDHGFDALMLEVGLEEDQVKQLLETVTENEPAVTEIFERSEHHEIAAERVSIEQISVRIGERRKKALKVSEYVTEETKLSLEKSGLSGSQAKQVLDHWSVERSNYPVDLSVFAAYYGYSWKMLRTLLADLSSVLSDFWIKRPYGIYLRSESEFLTLVKSFEALNEQVLIDDLARELGLRRQTLTAIAEDVLSKSAGEISSSHFTIAEAEEIRYRIATDRRAFPVALTVIARFLKVSERLLIQQLEPGFHHFIHRPYGIYVSVRTREELIRKVQSSNGASRSRAPSDFVQMELVATRFGLSIAELGRQLAVAVGYEKPWRTNGVSKLDIDRLMMWRDSGTTPRFPSPDPITLHYPMQLDVLAARFGIDIPELRRQLRAALGHEKQWDITGVSLLEVDRLNRWRDSDATLRFPSPDPITLHYPMQLDVLAARFGIDIPELRRQLFFALGHEKQWDITGVSESDSARLEIYRDAILNPLRPSHLFKKLG